MVTKDLNCLKISMSKHSEYTSECRVITFFVSIFGYQIHFWK